MDKNFISTQKTKRPLPIILAFPRVYKRLIIPDWRDDFKKVFDKCCELARNRPAPEYRHGGFFGLGGLGDDKMLGLYTVWSGDADTPDIFIVNGPGDGFGPGHTCPNKEELRNGNYGNLIPVPFFLSMS